MIDDATADRLAGIALKLRYDLLEMIGVGKAGHLGGSSSLAETIAALYFHVLRFDPNDPKSPGRDRLILSKGHAALIQYAALCELGFFPREELGKVKTLNGLLQGHPDLSIPGIEAVTGSLGQGLSIGVGMALALRLDRRSGRVFVIMGDGEQSEGQLWEAAMSAAAFRLDNLTAFLDRNNVQATGPTDEVFRIPDLEAKWSSFGWEVFTVNGHDVREIVAATERAAAVKGKPAVVVLNTVKGKGFSFAEGNATFHNGILTEEQFARAHRELDEQKARVGSWKN
jgi:transketolase